MAKIMCRYCKLNGYYLVTNNRLLRETLIDRILPYNKKPDFSDLNNYSLVVIVSDKPK